jgi:hypothetical protein
VIRSRPPKAALGECQNGSRQIKVKDYSRFQRSGNLPFGRYDEPRTNAGAKSRCRATTV